MFRSHLTIGRCTGMSAAGREKIEAAYHGNKGGGGGEKGGKLQDMECGVACC